MILSTQFPALSGKTELPALAAPRKPPRAPLPGRRLVHPLAKKGKSK